jgi:hypothetical protein
MDGCLEGRISFTGFGIREEVVSNVLEEITHTFYPVGTKYDFRRVKWRCLPLTPIRPQ